MNITWKLAEFDGIGEETWILDGAMGFLVTKDMTGKWFIVCADRSKEPNQMYWHLCSDMADGKALVEAQIRRLAN